MALRPKHRCDPSEGREREQYARCGACLAPATEEDYQRFREPERRRRIVDYLGTLLDNDAKALAEFRRCVGLL